VSRALSRFDCDVLVVGLGPVGAALAALLGQRGVNVIALEKDADVYPLPRAVHFDHEIMRLFQQLGLAEAVLAHARPVPDYEFRAADGQVLMRLPRAQASPSGWGAGYMFHQPSLDALLRAKAVETGADLRLGWRLEGFAQDPAGVTAEVVGPRGAAAIRARYLVGCDGAWSPVREAIGGGLFDYQFDEPWLVVDVEAGEGARLPEVNIQLCDPARPTTCVLGGPGRHRWEFMLLPGESDEQMLADGVVEQLLAAWDCGDLKIERKAVYRFHGLVANRWRAGRAMIAGDAAHQTPPFAGQGMCSGLRDAANLAWKLEAALRGRAGEALLDTYQTEREPHVRAAIALAIGMGRVVCTLDPAAAEARNAGMLAGGGSPLPPIRPSAFAAGSVLAGSAAAGSLFPQPTVGDGVERVRLDDRLSPHAWLISRATPTVAAPEGVCLVDPGRADLAPFRPALTAWLEKQGAEAVLVRPDRYVFGTGAPAALLAAWGEALDAAAAALASAP